VQILNDLSRKGVTALNEAHEYFHRCWTASLMPKNFDFSRAQEKTVSVGCSGLKWSGGICLLLVYRVAKGIQSRQKSRFSSIFPKCCRIWFFLQIAKKKILYVMWICVWNMSSSFLFQWKLQLSVDDSMTWQEKLSWALSRKLKTFFKEKTHGVNH
jgi:hypothetical protein